MQSSTCATVHFQRALPKHLSAQGPMPRNVQARHARAVITHQADLAGFAAAQVGSMLATKNNTPLFQALQDDAMLSPAGCAALSIDANIHKEQHLPLAKMVAAHDVTPTDQHLANAAVTDFSKGCKHIQHNLLSMGFPATATASQTFCNSALNIMETAIQCDRSFAILDVFETTNDDSIALVKYPGSMAVQTLPVFFPYSDHPASVNPLPDDRATITCHTLMEMAAGWNPSAILALQRHYPVEFDALITDYQGMAAYSEHVTAVKMGSTAPLNLPYTRNHPDCKGVLLLSSLADVATIVAKAANELDSPCFELVNKEASCHNRPFCSSTAYTPSATLAYLPYSTMAEIEAGAAAGLPRCQERLPPYHSYHSPTLYHYSELPAAQQPAAGACHAASNGMPQVLKARADLVTILNHPGKLFSGLNYAGSNPELDQATITFDDDDSEDDDEATSPPASPGLTHLPTLAAALMMASPTLSPEAAGLAAAAAIGIKQEDMGAASTPHKRARI